MASPRTTASTRSTVWRPSTGSKTYNGLTSANGLSTYNGVTTFNGIGSTNGLTTFNGLPTSNGLYLQRAARHRQPHADRYGTAADKLLGPLRAPPDHSVTKTYNGTPYKFNGQLGLAPEWEKGQCGTDCQEWVSAWIRRTSTPPAVTFNFTWSATTPVSVGSVAACAKSAPKSRRSSATSSPRIPKGYYCHGWGFTNGVVEGRLGGGQGAVPYTDAFNGRTCSNSCNGSDNPTWVKVSRPVTAGTTSSPCGAPTRTPSTTSSSTTKVGRRFRASSSMLQAATSTAKAVWQAVARHHHPGLYGGSRRSESATSLIPAGSRVSFKLWVPANSGLTDMSPMSRLAAGVGAGDPWGEFTTNTWMEKFLVAPAGCAITKVGLQFTNNTSWTGTVYLDGVQWGAAAAPSRSISARTSTSTPSATTRQPKTATSTARASLTTRASSTRPITPTA